MTGEIRNPAKLPTDLNPAEEYFIRCLTEGKTCRVGNGELPEKAIESGDGANMVRSEVIRFFAYGGNEENPVLGSEICLLGAWISRNLNLTHASVPYALMFGKCHFAAFCGDVTYEVRRALPERIPFSARIECRWPDDERRCEFTGRFFC